MRPRHLVLRGLRYYWRTNVAVIAGVATAVAVLAGALLVGDSVRASLRDLVLQRLGNTDVVVVASTSFFREQLAADIRGASSFDEAFSDLAPLIVARAVVTAQESGRRAGDVRVYGVDDRFWRFHGVTAISGPADRDALVSPALAREIGAASESAILVRVERPSDIPLESLHGRKEEVGRPIRAVVRGTVTPEHMGEFSLEPQQGDVRAVFMPLSRLQLELEVGTKVNALLASVSGRAPPGAGAPALEQMVRAVALPADVGLTVDVELSERHGFSIRSDAGLLDDRQAASAREALGALGFESQQPVFTYLANTLRSGTREIPYSLVAAIDLQPIPSDPNAPNDPNDPIVLNTWAARELGAAVGDQVTMEYYRWLDSGELGNGMATFRVASITPVDPSARRLVPSYPGISDSPSLEDWDPPFPVDLRRIRPVDEAYWDEYRTTPKAFIPIEVGQRLWRSRHGAVTSIHAYPPAAAYTNDSLRLAMESSLRTSVDPLASGLAVRDVRAESLSASRGATDFGQYFI
jgi:putative ABC transport system permease protein